MNAVGHVAAHREDDRLPHGGLGLGVGRGDRSAAMVAVMTGPAVGPGVASAGDGVVIAAVGGVEEGSAVVAGRTTRWRRRPPP